MNHADTVEQRVSEQDNKLDDQCLQVARENERRRAAQQSAQANAANSRAAAAIQLNQAYETAKQTYNDTKRVGNLLINPREEVGRIVGEKIAEFGQQGVERLRGGSPPQHPEYNAAHDRLKDLNDAVPRAAGIHELQDATLDELKRRNNQTLAEIDSLDKQIAEFSQAAVSAKIATGSKSGSTLREPNPGATDSDLVNPWANGSGQNDDSGGRRAMKFRTATNDSGATGSSVPSIAISNDANPWAESSLNHQAELTTSNAALATSPDSAASSNPFTGGPSSWSTQTLTYLDPGTGTTYKIPKGYTLFRYTKTSKLSVVKATKARIAGGGDQLDSTMCSRTGVGVVTPICEVTRKNGL